LSECLTQKCGPISLKAEIRISRDKGLNYHPRTIDQINMRHRNGFVHACMHDRKKEPKPLLSSEGGSIDRMGLLISAMDLNVLICCKGPF
jgi:hypothetical protein